MTTKAEQIQHAAKLGRPETAQLGGENSFHIAGERGTEIKGFPNDFNTSGSESYSSERVKRTAVQGCSSAVERSVHIGKVGGSTPSTPTGRTAPYNRGKPKIRQFYRVNPENLPDYFWSKVAIGAPAHCWPWKMSLDADGYGRATYGGKPWIASRLAFFIATGENPRGLVCHRCNNPACCNPGHLYAGTKSDNEKDKFKAGRSHKGGNNPASILYPAQVEEIRRLIAEGHTNVAIAAEYEVHHSTISKIRTGNSW